MNPKQKAKELIDKLRDENYFYEESILSNAKANALIVVDEIDLLLQNSTPKDDLYANLSSLEYWQEVKSEIEKMYT